MVAALVAPLVAAAAGGVAFYPVVAAPGGGGLYSAGRNLEGELGNGTTDNARHSTMASVAGLSNVISVAGSDYSPMALKSDGTVWTWGYNNSGQLGNGTCCANNPTPAQVSGVSGVIAISEVQRGEMALEADGSVWMWGNNSSGQLGTGACCVNSSTPAKVLGLGTPGIVAIAAGWHPLAVRADGTVWTWGSNIDGELGTNTCCVSSLSPVEVLTPGGVTPLVNAVAVAESTSSAMALKADGTVVTWGSNTHGELGNGACCVQANRPVTVAGLTTVKAIAVNEFFDAVLLDDGTVRDWGFNQKGELGNNTCCVDSSSPVNPGMAGVKAISAGGFFMLAVKSDGTAWSWGSDATGELGDGSALGSSPVPVQVVTISGAVAVAGGEGHSLVVTAADPIQAWGSNSNGQLGDGGTTNRDFPVPATSITGAVTVATGGHHTLVLKSDGTVWAWGLDINGQLGDTFLAEQHVPVQVSGLSSIIAIAAGASHSLALRSDGTVWSWGLNGNGQLGDSTTTQRPAAVQVCAATCGGGFLTGVVAIAAGASHSLALKSSGVAYAWGLNTNGRLGDGGTTQRLMPVTVSTVTLVRSIAAGANHSLALKSDGTVWGWGLNGNGQLGDNTVTQRLVPTQATTITGATALAGGGSHTVALKSDGTVWAWGLNGNGQLGDTTVTQRLVPTQASTVSGVTAVDAGATHSVALKSDGTALAWGLNGSGQLADDVLTDSHVAVLVHSLGVVDSIAAGASGDHTVTIGNPPACSGSGLSFTAPAGITFGTATLNGLNQTLSVGATITPSDLGGTGNGWSVSAQTTQLTNAGAKTLPTNALYVSAASSAAASGNCSLATNTVGYPAAIPVASAGKIFNSAINTGRGPIDVLFTMALNVPANASSGSYLGTMTVTIASGP